MNRASPLFYTKRRYSRRLLSVAAVANCLPKIVRIMLQYIPHYLSHHFHYDHTQYYTFFSTQMCNLNHVPLNQYSQPKMWDYNAGVPTWLSNDKQHGILTSSDA
jgi:hypothetical protein